MARVTIEDCIRHYPNRFEMVLLAARRARQLMNGHEAMVEEDENNKDKPPVVALREIGKGLMSWETLHTIEEIELRRQQEMEDAQN